METQMKLTPEQQAFAILLYQDAAGGGIGGQGQGALQGQGTAQQYYSSGASQKQQPQSGPFGAQQRGCQQQYRENSRHSPLPRSHTGQHRAG